MLEEISKEKIDTTFLDENWKNFLEQHQNILFSAPFGTGKSLYLEDFFERKKENFLSIHLSVIHYPIKSNEDILKWIESDIFLHLLEKGVVKEKEIEKFSLLLYAQSYLLHNREKIGEDLIDLFVPKKWKKAGKIIIKHIELFEKGRKEIQKDWKYEEIVEHLKKHHQTNSLADPDRSLYEELLTEILSADQRKKVLIIDDLDRMDPQYIFRILNIFSANFKQKEEKWDLFGFDHLIFVADYQKLKNIYAHFYGSNTDFEGYISKFKEGVYHFDPQKIMAEAIETKIKNLELYTYRKTEGITFLLTKMKDRFINKELNIRKWSQKTKNLDQNLKKITKGNSPLLLVIYLFYLIYPEEFEQEKRNTTEIFSHFKRVLTQENINYYFYFNPDPNLQQEIFDRQIEYLQQQLIF